ncbi:WW domain-containing protein [Seiridium cupressi]
MASPKTSLSSPNREAAPATDLTHDLALTTDGATAAEAGETGTEKEPVAASSPGTEQSQESGEASPLAAESKTIETSAPPLPSEPPPAAEDDGWEFHWDETNQAYYFHNHKTGESTWDNPRLPKETTARPSTTSAVEPPKDEEPPAGGYNPAIHGDYDPNAWYAKKNEDTSAEQPQTVDPAAAYAAIGSFNRFTGRWQGDDQNPDQHNDENKSRRQMNAFFDVDAAANAHDGRSLRAERSGKKPSKNELKQFKEKRRAKKEEKRRAWLRD